jgi:hypothetical protein
MGALMRKLTNRERRIASKFRKQQRFLERGSYYYQRADSMGYQIAKLLKLQHGAVARITIDGKGVMLIDKYLEAQTSPKRGKNDMPKAWSKATSVRQFEIKEINLFHAD